MGTSYSVKISENVPRQELADLQSKIETTLLEINRQMSTWDSGSEISAFNQSGSTKPFQVSEAFAEVIRKALELSKSTDGAFDPTLNPLLNLWGFGSAGYSREIPSDEKIEKARSISGWQHLHMIDSSSIKKDIPELQLDLGAIAKGYAVDAVAEVVQQKGIEHFFVEIGGEVKASGKNPDGVPWRIGVQYPAVSATTDDLEGILNICGHAVATSGDYRNYIEGNGAIYSHILDPRTGRPSRSSVASVTVIGSSCMEVDGIATALFVMGAEDGMNWVESRPEYEVLFLVRAEKGEIIEKFSSGFKALTDYSRCKD